jgi:DNA topoisomerase-1
LKPADVDLDTALRLLALPRELGRHPETGEPILAGIGRFGPYIKHGATFRSLGPDDDVLTIGANRAVVLLAEPAAQRRAAPRLLRELGEHPEGGTVAVYAGRYGPYVSHDGVFASLPRTADPDSFSLDQAVPLLAAQRQKGKNRQRKSGRLAAAPSKPRKAAKAVGGAKKPGTKRPGSRPGVQPG